MRFFSDKMCGSFTCSKNTLVGLNVIYILVSFLMIGVAVHGKHVVDMYMDIEQRYFRQSIGHSDLLANCGGYHCLWHFSAYDLCHWTDWCSQASSGIRFVWHCRLLLPFPNPIAMQVLLFFYMVVLFLIFLIQVIKICYACLFASSDILKLFNFSVLRVLRCLGH